MPEATGQSQPVWRLAQIATAILSFGLVYVASTMWPHLGWIYTQEGGRLPLLTELTVASPAWVNLLLPILLGPVFLVAIRRAVRGRDSLWLLAPAAVLVAYGALSTLGAYAPFMNRIEKPVIYLYPANEQRVDVSLSVDGLVTTAIPAVDPLAPSWSVTARPDGTITADGRRYPYLYWEALMPLQADMSSGFLVGREDVPAFLEQALARQGLTPAERRDFADYWLARMQATRYVLVRFEGPAYERHARLQVSPRPDATIRVFMVFRTLDAPVRVTPQALPSPPARRGFVVVEWGGMQLD